LQEKKIFFSVKTDQNISVFQIPFKSFDYLFKKPI